MKIAEIPKLAGEHPYATGGIVFGVGLVLLWYFGFFSSSSSASSSSSNNLASAFYAAEAAQAVAGTQLQLATVQATNQTAQVQSQATAAVGIAKANDTASLGIAASQFGAATTINGQNTAAAEAIASTNEQGAVDITHTNATTALQAAWNTIAGTLAGQVGTALLPSAPGSGIVVKGSPTTGFDFGAVDNTPAAMAAVGFTPSQIANNFKPL